MWDASEVEAAGAKPVERERKQDVVQTPSPFQFFDVPVGDMSERVFSPTEVIVPTSNRSRSASCRYVMDAIERARSTFSYLMPIRIRPLTFARYHHVHPSRRRKHGENPNALRN